MEEYFAKFDGIFEHIEKCCFYIDKRKCKYDGFFLTKGFHLSLSLININGSQAGVWAQILPTSMALTASPAMYMYTYWHHPSQPTRPCVNGNSDLVIRPTTHDRGFRSSCMSHGPKSGPGCRHLRVRCSHRSVLLVEMMVSLALNWSSVDQYSILNHDRLN